MFIFCLLKWSAKSAALHVQSYRGEEGLISSGAVCERNVPMESDQQIYSSIVQCKGSRSILSYFILLLHGISEGNVTAIVATLETEVFSQSVWYLRYRMECNAI